MADEQTRDNFDSFFSGTFHDLNQSMCNMGKGGYTSLVDDAESCAVNSHQLTFQSTRDEDAILLDRTMVHAKQIRKQRMNNIKKDSTFLNPYFFVSINFWLLD